MHVHGGPFQPMPGTEGRRGWQRRPAHGLPQWRGCIPGVPMPSSCVFVDLAAPWRSAGGAVAARPGGRWFSAGAVSRQRGFRRLVALMVAIFLPAVTAMLLCEVDCSVQALASGGQEHGQHDPHRPTAHATSHSSVDQPDAHEGACHLAGACWIAVTASEVSAVLRVQDQWVPGAELRFASLIWPPPQQRPKAIFS